GTSWYHSHYGVQYGDGAWGAIQINGPATAEYDIDLGAITLSEIYNQSAWLTALQDEQPRPRPVPARNILVNGTKVNFQDRSLGKRFQTTFTPKMKHRLRFINTAADTVFQVSLDSHNMTVIQSDFVPVRPYTTNSISIAIGQRYDVIIEANQPTASYWLRAVPQDTCGEANDNRAEQNVTGFITYEGSSGLPTQSAPLPPANTRCEDETRLIPYLPITVPKTRFTHDKDVLDLPVSGPVNVTFDGVHNVTRWLINNQAIDVDWSYPTLQQLHEKKLRLLPPPCGRFRRRS
ncbi:laccase, partial [Auricularia subglabra TFB-10046 SS5]